MNFQRVKSFFLSRHIHASDEWINSCISWCKQNCNPETLTDNFVQVIYDQWLIADLRDIEFGCLPENLKSYKKITLSGKYALQMNYIIDSSKPAYSQLQIIRNINTSNERVTGETQNTFISAPKPNRVLNLLLCDGVQEVKGMEYRPIKKLHTDLAPGIKLLIIGPVDCRNGVLFLTESNIEILGGEIEEILIKNAYENVLCRMIGLPENLNLKTSQNNSQNENILIENFDVDDNLMASIPTFEHQNTEIKTEEFLTDAQIDAKIDEEFQNIDIDFETTPSDREISMNKIKSSPIEIKCSLDDDFYEIDDIIEPVVTQIVPKIVSSQPFVYIKQLVSNRSNLSKRKYTVKARIKTLVDKLKFVNNQWVLKCEIVDATSSIVVDFSNRVTEELVGYTAEQMQVIRREIATSNFHKDQVVQALENAKMKLLSLDCLMELEFSETKPNPVVTKLQEFYYSHLSCLERRILLITS